MTVRLHAMSRVVAGLIAAALGAAIFSLGAARPAGADTCLVVNCPSTSEVIGAAGDAIPGLGAATTIIGTVGGAVGGAVASVAQQILDQIGQSIAGAVGSLFGEVSAFLTASSSPQVTVASFVAGDGAYHQVAELAALAMVGFMFLAVIQGALGGDALAVLGRMARNVPLAVLAIVGFPWAVDQLVRLVDSVCASLLPTGASLATIAGVYTADQVRAAVGGFSIPAILTELFVFCGGMLIYAELVVRAALVTVVVALAPLSFAAMVWPAARGAARKVVELVTAIVVSKLAIWVALAVGIALFQTQAASVLPNGQAWGQMISGAAIIAVAVFAPFVVWRLLPVAEAAVIAQGLSRMPGRAGMNTAQTANMWRPRGGAAGGGSGEEHPALAELPSRSLGGTPDAGPSGGAPPAAAASAPGGAPSAGGAGGVAGTAGGAGTAAGGAAAAAPVVAVIETAKMVKDRVVASADAQSQGADPPGAGSWSFLKPEPTDGAP